MNEVKMSLKRKYDEISTNSLNIIIGSIDNILSLPNNELDYVCNFLDVQSIQASMNLIKEFKRKKFEKDYQVFECQEIVDNIVSFLCTKQIKYDELKSFMRTIYLNRCFKQSFIRQTTVLLKESGVCTEESMNVLDKFLKNKNVTIKNIKCDLGMLCALMEKKVKLPHLETVTTSLIQSIKHGQGIWTQTICTIKRAKMIIEKFMKMYGRKNFYFWKEYYRPHKEDKIIEKLIEIFPNSIE